MAFVVAGLKKSFKDVHALQQLDFQLESGASMALLGPNGAGKSTAVKMLASLIVPDGGSIHHGDEDLLARPDRLRQLIGYVSQEMAMDKVLTGLEFLRFNAGLYHLDWKTHRDRAITLLKTLGLGEAMDRRVGTYSGGMKRRLDLASALLSDPKILILDEPTTGLDIDAREQIWEMVRRFMADGGSLILASHDFREVGELAAQILILKGGTVISRGSAQGLKDGLGNFVVRIRTREYMKADDIEAVKARLKDWPEPLRWHQVPDLAAFALSSKDELGQVQDKIYAAVKDLGLVSLNVHAPRLEDVYRFSVGGEA